MAAAIEEFEARSITFLGTNQEYLLNVVNDASLQWETIPKETIPALVVGAPTSDTDLCMVATVKGKGMSTRAVHYRRMRKQKKGGNTFVLQHVQDVAVELVITERLKWPFNELATSKVGIAALPLLILYYFAKHGYIKLHPVSALPQSARIFTAGLKTLEHAGAGGSNHSNTGVKRTDDGASAVRDLPSRSSTGDRIIRNESEGDAPRDFIDCIRTDMEDLGLWPIFTKAKLYSRTVVDDGVRDAQPWKLALGKMKQREVSQALYACLVSDNGNDSIRFFCEKGRRLQEVPVGWVTTESLHTPFNRIRKNRDELQLLCQWFFLVNGYFEHSAPSGLRERLQKCLEHIAHPQEPEYQEDGSLNVVENGGDYVSLETSASGVGSQHQSNSSGKATQDSAAVPDPDPRSSEGRKLATPTARGLMPVADMVSSLSRMSNTPAKIDSTKTSAATQLNNQGPSSDTSGFDQASRSDPTTNGQLPERDGALGTPNGQVVQNATTAGQGAGASTKTPPTEGPRGTKRSAVRANIEELERRSGAKHRKVIATWDKLIRMKEADNRRIEEEAKVKKEVLGALEEQDKFTEKLVEAQELVDASAEKEVEAQKLKEDLNLKIQDLIRQRDAAARTQEAYRQDKETAACQKDVIARQKENVDLKVNELNARLEELAAQLPELPVLL